MAYIGRGYQMLPFMTNVKIFIIEFVCVLLLQTVYGISNRGMNILIYVAACMIPVLLMALIAIKVKNENVVIRILYISATFTFFFMGYILDVEGTLPFMFLAIGVTIALFLKLNVLAEYLILTVVSLIIVAVTCGAEIDSSTDISLYI